MFSKSTTLNKAWARHIFSRRFMPSTIAILVIGVGFIGSWMAKQIETSEINSAAAISAIYMESIMAAELHDLPRGEKLSSDMHAEFDHIFVEGPLHKEILSFKLWDAGGYIYYSSNPSQTGLQFPVEGPLATAFTGTVQARIITPTEPDYPLELAQWPRLLEIYVPILSDDSDKVFAVAELKLSVENMERDIFASQLRSWVLVGFITLALLLLLLGFRRLCSSFDENDRMREQLREAGARTTTLNEEILLRIAADLHDGPAQTIAFALMRFNEFTSMCRDCPLAPDGVARELGRIQTALQSSLQNVRRISSGLAIPGMSELSLGDVVRRAVLDFEHMSGLMVEAEVDKSPDKAPLAVKITVYRLLQESLNNCMLHAPGGIPRVRMQHTGEQVQVTITDQGTGFDPPVALESGRLGLAFMRERVRLLGGIFEINSAPGRGTCIRARIPLTSGDTFHA